MIGIFINLWNRLIGAGGAAISYVLDEYSGAAAAYSLRKLSSTYGGSAVRVRRASDNTEQDIGFVGQDLDETALMNFVGYQNLFQRSEEFNDAYWAKIFTTVTPDTILSPINTLTADSVFETTANSTHGIQKSVSVTLGQSYNFSCYVRPINGREGVVFRFGNGASDGAIGTNIGDLIFTFSTETLQTSLVTDARFQKIGDWYRISCSVIPTAVTLSIAIWDWNGSAASYTGDPTKGLYLWGAQLNAGTTAQPYQVTTSAARSGDGFVTKWYTQDSNGENLLLQSQTFENIYWLKYKTTVSSNTTTAPDGTLTADSLIDDSTNDFHSTYVGLTSIVNGARYNFSFYAKAGTKNWLTIHYANNTPYLPYRSYFNLSTGQFGITDPTMTVSSSSVGNGWYRISASFISPSTTPTVAIELANGDGQASYLGNGTGSIFIWGAQLSQSTWLQPYQVTTTTAILRRDASQSTAANQPRIVGGGVIIRENGKAAVDHTNTQILKLSSSLNFGTTYTLLAAFKHDAAGREVLGNTSPVAYGFYQDSIGAYHNASTAFGFTSSGYGIDYNLMSLYRNGTVAINLFRDGIQYASQFNISANSNWLFNNLSGEDNPLYNLDGRLSEAIIYPTALVATLPDINRNIGAYYQTHWTGASSGLLDQFGGAAAAYSLRNLSSSYRGPLIRVRRSSDNAETDIGGTYNGDLDVASLVSFTGGQNLLLNSDNFTATSWGLGGLTVTSNVTIAPDGTLTADSLNETATNQNHVIYQPTNPSVAGPITSSVYLKAKERRYVSLSVATNGPTTFIRYGVIVDLQEGVITRSDILRSASGVYYSVSNAGNGWWRVSVSINATTVGVNSNFIVIALSNSPNPVFASDTLEPTYLGVAGSGVYVWGAQLNTGILQPYIPTTTAAVNGANAFVTKWYTQDNNYQNLLLYSEQFQDALWAKNAITATANTTTAPDGTLTADSIIPAIASGYHYVLQSISKATSVITYTASCYIKSAGYNYATVGVAGAGFASQSEVTVDLVTLQKNQMAITGSIVVLSSSVSDAGNGWCRVSLTFSSDTTNTLQVYIRSDNSFIPTSYTGNGTSGAFIWGAQLNEGTLVPYTATTTTASQRRDAIQATAASQPRIVNAGGVESEGNRPAVFWTDGSGMRLTASFQPIPSPQTFFAVNRIAATSGISAATLFDSYESVQNVYYFKGTTESPNNVFSYADTTLLNGPANPIPVQNITNVIHDTVTNVYDNNLLTISGSVSTNSLSGLSIGNLRGNPTPIVAGYDWFGDIQELVVYPSNLATRLAVNSNINSYYRIYWQGNGTALLDNYSGASAAYSLRNLSSAYTGPLIRVRRSNDNVERDIYGTFGGDLDIASLVAFVGANSGFVTTWYDQSGNATHATQATAGAQPRIVNAGVVETEGGKPTLFFDGSDDFFNITSINVDNLDWSAFHVSKNNSAVTVGFGIGPAGSTGGGPYFGRFSDGNIYIQYVGAVDSYYTVSETSTAFNLRSGFARSSSANFYLNGSNVTLSAPLPFPPSTTSFSYIGRYLNAAFSNAEASELILYIGDRSSSRTAIESNINNYYKIY